MPLHDSQRFGRSHRFNPRLTLRSAADLPARLRPAPEGLTLGGGVGAPPPPLSLFEPVELPIDIDESAAVLGGADQLDGVLEYTPDDAGVYILLQQFELPGGVVYDIRLPEAPSADGILGGAPGPLRFPLVPLPPPPPAPPLPALAPPPPTLGGATLGLDSIAGELVGGLVGKRVVQLFKSQIDSALRQAVAQTEPKPAVLALRDTLTPLEGAESWRALLPPGQRHRALLHIHGFASSTANSHADTTLLPALASGYAAALGYTHPTFTRDPLQNARDLLERIPPDVELELDIVAHSRGGLVARCLAELAEPRPNLRVRSVVTCGTPHAGTTLAEPQRWDRLISIALTAANWLAAGAGATVVVTKLLEYLIKAAAQGVFDLPGVQAMCPGSDLLKALDAGGGPGAAPERYAAVASRFTIFAPNMDVVQGLGSLAAQAFMAAPNDLVVPTSSMLACTRVPEQARHMTDTNHFSYFKDGRVLDFLRETLRA
jgi:hypothetical protein